MKEVIQTDRELCVGCNRCVRECPMELANVTYQDDAGNIKVKIDHEKCINCGRCITACTHKARQYNDDTERFFDDLASGMRISLIAAPSIRTNIPEYRQLFSYLKSAGVNKIYDVSLGADICIWAHVRHFARNGATKLITQPCPAVVSYCEIYKPELLEHLSPVHSPMACAAIHMKKYEGIGDSIAALSPCIAKTDEFEFTKLTQYNVTFTKLQEYLINHNIALPDAETGFDYFDNGLGSLFPMPGGLTENIEFFLGKKLQIAKAEGSGVFAKLDAYFDTDKTMLPAIFDVLNCAEGCNIGSACTHNRNIFEINHNMGEERRKATENRKRDYYDSLYAKYDAKFALSDFIRRYQKIQTYKPTINEEDVLKAYSQLGKLTYEKQHIDCGACGSDACYNMARKIALGVSIADNCIVKAMETARDEHEKNLVAYEQLGSLEKMREADERIRIMLDATPLGAFFINRELRMIDCNREAMNFFKLSDKQALLENYIGLSPERQPDGQLSIDKVAEVIISAFESGRHVFEWTFQLQDGEYVPAEVTMVSVDHRGENLVVGFTRDLREQKQMMRDIERRDSLLNTVNNAATVLISTKADDDIESSILKSMELVGRVVDVDRVHIWKNETADDKLRTALLYQWQSEAGKLLNCAPPGMKIYFSDRSGWEDMFLRGEYINSRVAALGQADQLFFAQFAIKSIVIIPLYVEGHFWGIFSMDDCKRERHFSDDEINILHSAGLLIISALIRNDMTQSLKDAVLAKSNFLANMSHEIRTPMNAIIGMTNIGRASAETDRKDYAFDRIGNASSHLLGVINDILDVSKIEAGKFDLIYEDFDFENMLQKVIDINLFRIEEKRQKITVNIDKNIPYSLVGDDQRLTQVITNLLSNAVKFTDEGKSILLDARLVEEHNNLCVIKISVTDTGIGISAEQQTRIFSSFEQADDSTSRKYGGTGLGLVISKHIIELMGGMIWVDSKIGEGATFSFIINMRRGASKRENPLHPCLDTAHIRMLAVDDDQDFLDCFIQIADKLGIACDTAGSVGDALRLIEGRPTGEPYDICFIDWYLPEESSINFIREVATSRTAGSPSIVLISSYDWSDIEPEAAGSGVKYFLPKPLFASNVADCINKCLAGAVGAGSGVGAADAGGAAGAAGAAGVGIGAVDTADVGAGAAGVGIGAAGTGVAGAGAGSIVNVGSAAGVGAGAGESGIGGQPGGQPGGRASLSGYTILLAEDIEINREIVQITLEPMNIHIDCAENGVEAVRAFTAAQDKYDLILMDVQMPEMDGYETTRKIRSLGTEKAKTIPIIAMTANVFRDDIEKCIESGMNGHLGKPLDFDEVHKTLQKYLKPIPRN